MSRLWKTALMTEPIENTDREEINIKGKLEIEENKEK
jgi:hypothetical protein